MKYKAVISAIVAISVIAGAPAFAQGKNDRNDRGGKEQSKRSGNQGRTDNDWRQSDRNDNRGRGNDDRRNERGGGYNHQFYKGDRLPAEYRHRQYVVEDWRGHRLSAPPRGYHWVQSGGDYLLVAIATGVILQLFLNN